MGGDVRDLAHPRVDLDVSTSAAAVWSVLGDGWLYPLWVVGATHMRDVDPHWPALGARLHHSVGLWPVQLSDTTVVRAVDEGRRLELEARAIPVGTARVALDLLPLGPHRCRISILEYAESGPGRLVPTALQAPFIRARNTESLHRLADIAVHRAEAHHGG
jgi:hypothetical protein